MNGIDVETFLILAVSNTYLWIYKLIGKRPIPTFTFVLNNFYTWKLLIKVCNVIYFKKQDSKKKKKQDS